MKVNGTEIGAPVVDELPVFADVPPGSLPAAPDTAPVRTEGFRLAVVPTTIGQYWQYLADRGLDRAPAPLLHGFARDGSTGLRSTSTGTVVLDQDRSALPVTCVTWHGAVAYCDWLSARTGTECRLPSGAEWHYAASGPEGLRWALGNEFDRSIYAPPATGPRSVAGTPANAFGLHDMTGNVFEWCVDPLTAPDGTALGARTIKGGAYTVRNPESFDNATVFTADELSTVPYIGFRVLAGLRVLAVGSRPVKAWPRA